MPLFAARFHVVACRLFSLPVLLCLIASLFAHVPVASAPSVRIVYVKPDAPGGNSGVSWAEARSLQGALLEPLAGDEIWVAAGVYYPDEGTGQTNNSPTSTFQLKTNVALYGGFAGSEASRAERDPTTHVTVLSGDVDKNDTSMTATGVVTDAANIVGTNAYHVVTGSDTESSAILDGFTITAGSATGVVDSCTERCGGGLTMDNGTATLANLIFSGNRAFYNGGGMHVQSSSPSMTAITFTGNRATNVDVTGGGGGMYNNSSNPNLNNVAFSGNHADYGGGIYHYYASSTPTLTQVTFTGNSATHGAGIYNIQSSPALTNVTFSDNQASGDGGGMYNDASSPNLKNVTLSVNQAQGGGGGMYNYESSPILNKVTFRGNQAQGGGGMANIFSNPILTNVTFSGNRAQVGGGMTNGTSDPILTNVIFSGNHAQAGGGMYSPYGDPILTNVIFSGNQAKVGGGVMNYSSSTVFQNTIMWNNTTDNISNTLSNPTYSHSLVQGLTPGTTNLNGMDSGNDPLFVRPVNCSIDGCGDNPATADDESANDDYGDLRLQGGSPAIDAGDNSADLDGTGAGTGTATIASILTDLADQPRIVAAKVLPATVDMGAYERATTPVADAGGPYTVNEGSNLALDGTASRDVGGSVVAYAWDCTDDGSIDTSAVIATGSTCTYPDDGNFTLSLSVTDNVSATHTTTTAVTVANVAPTYTPAGGQSTFAASAKQFAFGSFADPGVEGSWPVTIDWGDNSPFTEFAVSATGSLPGKSHTYAAPGTYSVLLTVSDGEASADGGFQVTVNPLPEGAPSVTAPADQSATAATDQSFALGSFTDPNSSGPWQVSVNWGDGTAATQFNAASTGDLAAKSHTYAAADSFDVVVTVNDGALAASASFRITVSSGSSDTESVLHLPAVRRP